jgi:hypothetical protein
MKIGSIATGIVLSLALAATTTAFAPALTSTSTSTSTSTTRLFISSWGARGPPSQWKKEADPDPSQKIQAYLKPPEPILARPNLTGTVLVSGWVNSKERTDQTIFNFLNDEESAFKFTKIVAFVNDAKFAKKRLISRSSRYSGLLDKLDFVQAEVEGALPTKEQLEGVGSWVVYANAFGSDHLDTLMKIAGLAKSAHVLNVAILISDAQTITDAVSASDSLKAFEGYEGKYTVVAVGAISETPEGLVPYGIAEFGSDQGVLMGNATYSRDESLRIVAECLGLDSACNKAMVFTEIKDVNATEAKLVKGLREGGYTRPQEIDHMIAKGPEAYKIAIEEFKVRAPKVTPQDEWLIQKQKELDEDSAVRRTRVKAEYEEKKTKEIEDIAREWAKREYFRKATSGDMPYSEDEYIKSVWERALFEGDLKYRMLHGQETDERKELAEFKKKQEKKKMMALERAQQQLNAVLDDEDKLVKAGDGDDDDDE